MKNHKEKNREKNHQFSQHHIVPSSRGGSSLDSNIKNTTFSKHRAYHILFGNLLPEEAVKLLIDEWFYKDPTKRNSKLFHLTMHFSSIMRGR